MLDIAGNLREIAQWTRKGFPRDHERIELFLHLTRKDLNALMTFPLTGKVQSKFQTFCTNYKKLEDEYKKGITDHKAWADSMMTWSITLTQNAKQV